MLIVDRVIHTLLFLKNSNLILWDWFSWVFSDYIFFSVKKATYFCCLYSFYTVTGDLFTFGIQSHPLNFECLESCTFKKCHIFVMLMQFLWSNRRLMFLIVLRRCYICPNIWRNSAEVNFFSCIKKNLLQKLFSSVIKRKTSTDYMKFTGSPWWAL